MVQRKRTSSHFLRLAVHLEHMVSRAIFFRETESLELTSSYCQARAEMLLSRSLTARTNRKWIGRYLASRRCALQAALLFYVHVWGLAIDAYSMRAYRILRKGLIKITAA
jgi:hypothetical protein